MVASVKRAAPSKARPVAKSPTAKSPPATPDAPTGSYMRFYHTDELREKTLTLLAIIEEAEEASAHRDALAALVVELTNSGLDYCFIQQLKRAKPGFLVVQAANLGMVGAQQVMGSMIRQVVGRMDGPQLLSVCGSIRHLMR